MHTFGPALLAELAYRREDVRRSLRSARGGSVAPATSHRGTTATAVCRPVRVAGPATRRTA